MVRQTFIRAALLAGLTFGWSAVGYAADDKKPEIKTMTGASAAMLANTCAGCHGTDGASGGPATPTISGLSKIYFVELMEGFASGEIPSTVMGRIAKGYTKGEIKQLSDHFATLPFVPAKQPFNTAEAAQGKKIHDKECEKCHAEGGKDVKDDTGRLAGQWMPYLKYTMHDFISGKREMTRKMKKRVMKLHTAEGDKPFNDLFNYYASEQ